MPESPLHPLENGSELMRITIMADPLPPPGTREARVPSGASTGARVIIEFVCADMLPAGARVLLRYDFAQTGAWREALGMPEHAYVERLHGGAILHHYRLPCWIPAERVMEIAIDPGIAPRAA